MLKGDGFCHSVNARSACYILVYKYLRPTHLPLELVFFLLSETISRTSVFSLFLTPPLAIPIQRSIASKNSSNWTCLFPGPPLSLSVLIQLSSACCGSLPATTCSSSAWETRSRPSPWNRRRRPGRPSDHFFYFCFLVFFHLRRKKLYI